jgi:chromosome segregation ATPase
MPFLPLIANNLGKIAATLAAGTVGYANRKTIGRWLAGDADAQTETQACMREKAQEVRQLQGQMTLTDLDRKHSELLEKLNQANAAALSEMRTLTKDVRTEVADLRKGLQSQLDTQRTETMRLGKELSEMRERQEKMEMALRGAAPGTAEQQPTRSIRPAKDVLGDLVELSELSHPWRHVQASRQAAVGPHRRAVRAQRADAEAVRPAARAATEYRAVVDLPA